MARIKVPPEWALHRIKERLGYFGGKLIWVDPLSTKIKPGSMAGCVNSTGYVIIYMKNGRGSHINVAAHHIVWFLFTGEWPTGQLDHIDRNRTNNRFENLREASPSQNGYNRAANRANRLGEKGITFEVGSFRVRLVAKGVTKNIGRFKTLEEAIEARDKALLEHHGEFACLD